MGKWVEIYAIAQGDLGIQWEFYSTIILLSIPSVKINK